jgi:hypothetical protein
LEEDEMNLPIANTLLTSRDPSALDRFDDRMLGDLGLDRFGKGVGNQAQPKRDGMQAMLERAERYLAELGFGRTPVAR